VYIVKRFPRLSETFVVQEILHLERLVQSIVIQALLPPEPGPQQPEVSGLRAAVDYVPPRPRLWHPKVAAAHLSVFRRQPGRWLQQARSAARDGTWRRFLQAGVIAQRTERLGARHIHAHFATGASEVASAVSGLTGTPFSVTAHAKDIFSADNQPLLARRLAGAAAVVTVSRYNQNHLSSVLPGARVEYIANGMPLAPQHERDRHGPVLCVARLVPKKGIDTLIRAISLLDDGPGKAPQLEIVGGGVLLPELEELIHDLGLANRVHLLGAQPTPTVSAAFSRCSMMALACRVAKDGDRDGMPTVLLEAMARGLPVIATSVAGIPELVRHQDTGLLVPPDDPQGLAEAIDRLWSQPELADRLGRNARRAVGEEFNPDVSARRLAGVFNGQPRPTAPSLLTR